MGPNGEIVLFAVDSRRRLVGELLTIPTGADHIQMACDLYDRLDLVDPQPAAVTTSVRFPRLHRARIRDALKLRIVRDTG